MVELWVTGTYAADQSLPACHWLRMQMCPKATSCRPSGVGAWTFLSCASAPAGSDVGLRQLLTSLASTHFVLTDEQPLLKTHLIRVCLRSGEMRGCWQACVLPQPGWPFL